MVDNAPGESVSRGEPHLRKTLGQHFLTRPEACAPLIRFLRPAERDVVEIGPGDGVLTGALLAAGARRVVAWEIDPRWAWRVRERFAGERLEVIVGDAAALPWERMPAGSLAAGNLPYNVATRILSHLLEATIGRTELVERAGFLVQLEVGERLTAGPGDSAYGALSVLVATLARVEILGKLPPGAFRPPPRVDSAFVGLTPLDSDLDRPRWRQFARLVHASFAKRRKTLRNSLGASVGRDRAESLLEAAGLDRATRAESLSPADFRSLLGPWEAVAIAPPEDPRGTA